MKFKTAYLLILLFGNNCLFGQLNSSCSSKIDSLISAETNKPFCGVVLIGQQKEKLYLKTFGYSDREKQISIQENDQFVIGSISKQFTAVLVLRNMKKGD